MDSGFDWGQVMQVVLEAVLAVVLPVAVGALAMWLRSVRDRMLGQLNEQTRQMVVQAVEIAVRAAEQSGLAGLIRKEGRVKKEYAIGLAEKYLSSWGLEIDLDVLAAMIEAEVNRQFGGQVRVLPVSRQ